MNKKKINYLIRKAISILLENDRELLNPHYDINERTITYRLGIYLSSLFPTWKVDCEYNRMGLSSTSITKQVNLSINEPIDGEDIDAKTVFPDIIIHQRGTNDNLVAIEIKKAWSNSRKHFDLLKAKAYKESLYYKYSIYIELGPDGISYIEWL